MSENEKAADWTEELGSLRELVDGIATANSERLVADPKLLPGSRDPRLTVTGLRRVSGGDDAAGERLPLDLNTYLIVDTTTVNWAYTWAHEDAWEPACRGIVRLPGTDADTCRKLMFGLVPHTIRIATVIWHHGENGSMILMRLDRAGTPEKPASVIGFPNATLTGHDESFDAASRDLARGPFTPFPRAGWDVELDDMWTLLKPARPEILLVRHAEYVGERERFEGAWAEGRYYPFVWLPPRSVAMAAEDGNAALVRDIRSQDARYRALARDLEVKVVIDEACERCGSTLKAHSEKVPVKSSLTVTDDLRLDTTSRLVVESYAV